MEYMLKLIIDTMYRITLSYFSVANNARHKYFYCTVILSYVFYNCHRSNNVFFREWRRKLEQYNNMHINTYIL